MRLSRWGLKALRLGLRRLVVGKCSNYPSCNPNLLKLKQQSDVSSQDCFVPLDLAPGLIAAYHPDAEMQSSEIPAPHPSRLTHGGD